MIERFRSEKINDCHHHWSHDDRRFQNNKKSFKKKKFLTKPISRNSTNRVIFCLGRTTARTERLLRPDRKFKSDPTYVPYVPSTRVLHSRPISKSIFWKCLLPGQRFHSISLKPTRKITKCNCFWNAKNAIFAQFTIWRFFLFRLFHRISPVFK